MNESKQPFLNETNETGASIEAAKSEIGLIRQEAYMRNVDSELDEINTILKALEDGKYSPEQAVEKARKISNRMMDYK
jgi:uncharacterized membrane protein YjjP (DUF1212 family)